MRANLTPSAALHFSTRDLPARDRVPFWREEVARKLVQLDIEPISDRPFEAEATVLMMNGLAAYFGRGSPAVSIAGENS